MKVKAGLGFLRYTKFTNLQRDSSRKKGREPKSVKSQMKKEKLQPTPQKYKGS